MAWWSRTPGGTSPHKFALLGNRITGCRPRPDWHSAANANADHLDGLRDTDTESRSRPRTVLPQLKSASDSIVSIRTQKPFFMGSAGTSSSPEAMSLNSGKDRQSSSVVIVLNYHSPNRWVFSISSDENQSKACSEGGFPTDGH